MTSKKRELTHLALSRLWCWATLLLVLSTICQPSVLDAGEAERAGAATDRHTPTISRNIPYWSRIVMVGASASAGFTATEPLGGPTTAQYRLSRYVDAAIAVPHESISNLASTFFFMQPEVEAKRQIERALELKPTLLIGADFLFWFCYGEGSTDAARALRFENGLKLCESFRCPLVLGDIPDASGAVNGMLSPDEIPSPAAIAAANKRLRAWASSRSNTVVLPLSNFMAAVVANRPLSLHGVSLPEGGTGILLQSDKLHPSPPGCAVLALLILDSFSATRSIANEIRWDPKEVFRLAYNPIQAASKSSKTENPSIAK